MLNHPKLWHVRVELARIVREDEHAIVFSAMAADVRSALHLHRCVALNAVELRLIRMRIGAQGTYAAIDFDCRGYAMVGSAVRKVQVRVQLIVDPKSRGHSDLIIRHIGSKG